MHISGKSAKSTTNRTECVPMVVNRFLEALHTLTLFPFNQCL